VDNFGKIWSVHRQHEVQYIISGMYKYIYSDIQSYLHIFLYSICNKNILIVIRSIYKKIQFTT
jgi:hypothetical protein